ncbi:SARP family transcriptional regulator [Mangrovactinospora gilvigrisea]|uniref:SARP family transcriptional regulator n=1 Tax=Mangrovactinospora gilvigrisea TaxID=1428644 RepID=A0A1J7C2Y0_9ACTN|nr:AfsR/SARP family transcriptional regulator [Mangrovactinospora gilvigrisea]OIV35924.1 SARP family transcriptional regulator [Mangrovactinospora gilvigrisea]
MEFALLGTVAVRGPDGAEIDLGPAKRRSVLALLALQPNTAVPVERLVEALWEEEPPEHARTVIQGHVSKLRTALAGADAEAFGVELATRGSAYLLRLPPELIDAHRFGELVALARPREAPSDAVPLLREALALWRGPALSGTVTSPPFAAAAHALEERRISAVEALARAYDAKGEHEDAAAVLYDAAVAHPLREGLIAELMLTLYRSGRQSDAIEWFHRTRRLLDEELGIDPGRRLNQAYEEILRAEAEPEAAPSRPADPRAAAPAEQRPADPRAADPRAAVDPREALASAGPAAHTVPRLLPRPPARFLGREAQLDALTGVLTESGAADGGGPLAVVSGPAGVGKTACAVQWAHRHAEAFPDGQLFADLRGFGEGGASGQARPADVLRDFLSALGVPAEQLPSGEEAASALFRTLVADRRMLVVLDNAGGSAQVRPLLPGGPRSATLVTSRSRLDGLVATEWARPVGLRVLEPQEGVALLGAMLGPDRIADDPEAARELVALCGGLPLALRAASAQLAARPRWRLARLATALRDERRRLSLLSVEDTGIETALRMSVARLSADDARLLEALGEGLGLEGAIDASAAAALAGASPDQVEESLERLVDMHLIDEEATNRYVMSDLVKLFARRAHDSHEDGGAAG